MKKTQQKRPVILINGLLAPKISNLPFKWMLNRAGFSAHLIDLPPLNIADVRKIAARIKKGVDQVLKNENADECDILALSLGGITGLYYLKKLGGHLNTKKFIALGTPFKGTWAAMLLTPFIGAISRSIWQILPSNKLLIDLWSSPVTRTQVYSIHAHNDLVATQKSASLNWTENIQIKTLPFPLISHQALMGSKKSMETIIQILSGNENTKTIQPFLPAHAYP
ncbi:hypothetical protein K1X76_09100 [bacterium]|nr:hypothetical protein [bacterium]